ncbi:DNA primase [Candidatus Falkowbacteria bacterium]|nr:MAG: DNA primase [Candidatus Falkowbacteria bacterium]
MQLSDEIKAKLDIVDLIRDYIPLKAAGINFRARCPFHQEKTPSFMISPDKQIWHCFGCGKGGDIFSFIMEMEGVEFVEALRILAPKAGVVLRREDPKISSQRNRILDILELSRKYYHKFLLDSPRAEGARDYLEKRGFSDETIEEWQIGCSPDAWDEIMKFLKNKGFSENEIFLAGMSVKSNTSSRFYDRFRARIMFPINDTNSNTVAFTARVSPEKEETEKMGKYINSPQTLVYDKSKILFGLDKGKIEIKKQDLAIIVEGQTDVITAHQAGYKNVVASSGTALTADQDKDKPYRDLNNHINLIKRYTNNMALAFDKDAAGDMAANRGIQEAMALEMNISVIEIPGGKDPDECIKKNPKEWEGAVAQAKSMMEYYFSKTLEKLDLEKITDRRQVAKELLPIISKLGNSIEQDYWLKRLSEKIDVEENVLRETIRKTSTPKSGTAPVKREKEPDIKRYKSREERISELLLALIIKFPALLDYAINNILTDHIIGEQNRAIYKNLVFYYNNIVKNSDISGASAINTLSYEGFSKWLVETTEKDQAELISINRDEKEKEKNKINLDQLKLLEKLVFLSEKDFYDFDPGQAKNEAIEIILVLKKNYLSGRLKEMEKLIAKYEKAKKYSEVKELMGEFKVISDELRALDK